MKSATCIYWNEAKGYGFLAVTRTERYYFHISRIVEGPLGDLTNLKAVFDVEPPVAVGKLPQAVNIKFEGGVQ